MLVTKYLHFTRKLHFRNTVGGSVQCRVKDIINGGEFWLSFSTTSKMYPRVCNVQSKSMRKNSGEFKAVITYDYECNNRAKRAEGEALEEFISKYPEYMV